MLYYFKYAIYSFNYSSLSLNIVLFYDIYSCLLLLTPLSVLGLAFSVNSSLCDSI